MSPKRPFFCLRCLLVLQFHCNCETMKLLNMIARRSVFVFIFMSLCKIFSQYELAPILNTCLWCFSTYASKYIPIIASVSEHQPPTWPSYFMDINVLAFLVPAGIIVSSLYTKIFCLIFSFFYLN